MPKQKEEWRLAQNKVSNFLKEYHFGVWEEYTLPSGKRIDILAQKKVNSQILNVLIEVKNWNNVTRKKESDFCKQIINYLVEYVFEPTKNHSIKNNNTLIPSKHRNKYLGILILTKDTHFTFRKVSQHFFKKHEHIIGIDIREKLSDSIKLYVARFDFIKKVFEDYGYALYRDSSIIDWIE